VVFPPSRLLEVLVLVLVLQQDGTLFPTAQPVPVLCLGPVLPQVALLPEDLGRALLEPARLVRLLMKKVLAPPLLER
jgi:hypothetical protein